MTADRNTTGHASVDRRSFLQSAAGVAAAAAFAPGVLAGLDNHGQKAAKSLDILILGGTAFLGPHFIHAALGRGHNVTMFTRGRTDPTLYVDQFDRVESLVGDRTDDIAALEGDRTWDAVIDTSAYFPRVVEMTAGLLKDRVKHYQIISTMSVYGSRNDVGMDESAPVATIEDPTTEEITGVTYGPLKALCEEAAEKIMPGRVSRIRPGLIVGPGDRSDRYTYWPVRAHRGGAIAAPNTEGHEDFVQYVDVRDLAEWMVRVVEDNITGIYNAVTPGGERTMRSMLDSCIAAAKAQGGGADARVEWIDTAFLLEQGVQPWAQLPAWVPATLPGYEGFGRANVATAVGAGLTFRSERDTAESTLSWWLGTPEERQANLRAGLRPEAERAVLEAWAERESGEG